MSRNRFFSNPFSNEERYQRSSDGTIGMVQADTMTKQGALNKTFVLTNILLTTAVLSAMFPSMGLTFFGMIGGLVCALVAAFRPASAPITAPLYAAFQGLFLGTISILYAAITGGGEEIVYEVIAVAVAATLGVLVVMLVLYQTRMVKPTEKLRAVVTTAIGTIAFIYLVSFVLSITGLGSLPYLHTAHPIGILISLVIICVAALSLIFDFEVDDKGEAAGAPKYMEWMGWHGLTRYFNLDLFGNSSLGKLLYGSRLIFRLK